ncbi:hypothetical protein ACOSQ2_030851 [Xanthoceras sorbifolium]
MTKIRFFPLDLGNALLSGFFQVFFDRLAPDHLPHFADDNEVRSELNMWRTTLAMIQAVLSDAEEKQLTNVAVKLWLDDLRDLVYDAEDILDEYATETFARKLKEEHQSIAASIISVISNFKFNSDMMSNIEGVTSRLEKLSDQRNKLGLERIAGGTSTAVWQRPPTTCLPTEPAVFGRDEDKAKLIEMVLKDEPSDGANFRVISIVGMAGVGKTTLAQQVYHDMAMTRFYPKVWVCASHDFDVFRMSKAILESINHSSCDLKDLNEVQVQLKMRLAGRRFMLIVDDVWSKNYDLWETLKSPFITGAPGSRIIVTTRSIDVALTMGSYEYYDLKLLSNDYCWSVFARHAFESRRIDAHSNLESVRDQVVKKCGGLPLAARTLGGLLRSKQGNNEWEDILNSKIWDLPEESNILPVLKLSYHYLPSHLKRCFAYCSIFPKNYEFEETELVLLWMAEGLILPSPNNKQLEDIGREYFRSLLSMSIFQQSTGDASKFVMHNLVNDLAEWVSAETSFRLDDDLGAKKQLNRFQSARHSSYSCRRFNHKDKFEVFNGVDHLRTFLPIITHNLDCYISNRVLDDLFSKLKKLRVLSLRKYYITKLPDSITKLSYLRYLNLADTEIRSLPDDIICLFNLQILILRNCARLLKLPPYVGTLINLRHVDISGARLISEMPQGMQKLKLLQKLSNFIVGKQSGSSLQDLKDLKFLGGELCISKLQNESDLQYLKDAVLSDKKNLEVLILDWGFVVDNLRDEEKEKNILDKLRPHTNLLKLTVKYYHGREFPSWVGDPSFANMTVLRLEECKNCTSLPPLGLLSSLKELKISRMTSLQRIDSAFYGEGCSRPFQSLETLCLEDLQEWEVWDSIDDNEHVEIFHRLHELSIINCPKLLGNLPQNLPSLKKLVIQKCENLVVSFSRTLMPCELELDKCREMVYTNADEDDSSSVKSMSLSNISGCESYFRQMIGRVEHLKVKNCSDLTSFPEVRFLSSLTALDIEDCDGLASLQTVMIHSTCLGSLKIQGCKSLSFIVRGQLPFSLKRLEICNCENLRCLLELDTGNHLQNVNHINHINASLLEHLLISDCQSLATLVSEGQLPETLRHLKVSKCSELTAFSLGGQLPASLERLSIDNCPITTLSSTGDLPTSLQHLDIKFCSNLETLSSGQLPAGLRHLEVNSCSKLVSIHEDLHNLNSLHEIKICNCQHLVRFPQGGIPIPNLANLSIDSCRSLKAISMHSLSSLQELKVSRCPGILPLRYEDFPTNLTSLKIGGCLNIYAPLFKFGLHWLTSLKKLEIVNCPDATTFPEAETGMMLPTTLNHLKLADFKALRWLSPGGFRNLTSLESLCISDCPMLVSLDDEDLPSSLLELHISKCGKLKQRPGGVGGRDWSKLTEIPYVIIDNNCIHDPDVADSF